MPTLTDIHPSKSWTPDWVQTVRQRQTELDRPICGARTPAGTPCTLTPNHQNGRCKFHGGFDLTGAQPGNRNAELHGLYARRLQRCGPRCPLWKSCPCAGAEIEALPQPERPTCPYEQVEYDAIVNDLGPKLASHPDASLIHLVHTIALLQVMQNRAAAALSIQPLVQFALNFQNALGSYIPDKTNPILEALLRISREHRRYVKQFEDALLREPASPETSAYVLPAVNQPNPAADPQQTATVPPAPDHPHPTGPQPPLSPSAPTSPSALSTPDSPLHFSHDSHSSHPPIAPP